MSAHAADLEFCKVLAGRRDVDLVQLMFELAEDAYPQLDRIACLMEIGRLADACRVAVERIPCACPSERLAAVSRVLYQVEGFHGNRDDYYEPENSYINQVLERRTGLPIALGMLYIAVGSRTGLKLFPTNTPGHFVVGCHTHGEALFIDPFGHGEVLKREECRHRVEQRVGKQGIVRDEHFLPATPQEVTVRMLRNLKTAYGRREAWGSLFDVQKRLVALLPSFADERRDLGMISLRVGKPCVALTSFEACGKLCGGELDDDAQKAMRVARKMVAELN